MKLKSLSFSVLRWCSGVFFVLMALGELLDKAFLAAGAAAFLSVLLLPPLAKHLFKKIGIQIPLAIKVLTGTYLFFIMIGSTKPAIPQVANIATPTPISHQVTLVPTLQSEATTNVQPTIVPTIKPTNTPTAPKPATPKPTSLPSNEVKKSDTTSANNYSGNKNCSDFSTHAQAQSYFNSKGGSSINNVDGLDRDHDGVACENLP